MTDQNAGRSLNGWTISFFRSRTYLQISIFCNTTSYEISHKRVTDRVYFRFGGRADLVSVVALGKSDP